MKAWIYAVQLESGIWQAGASIHSEVTQLYWLDEDFWDGVMRREVRFNKELEKAADCSVDSVPFPRSDCLQNEHQAMCWGRSSQPLGIAVEAAERWNEKYGSRRLEKQQIKPLLKQMLEHVWNEHRAREMKEKNRKVTFFNDDARCMEFSWLAAGQAESGSERGLLRHAQGQVWAAAADAAVLVLQGRALLHSEAHDLLAAAGAALPAGASWDALLQLAAHQGRLRLCSAIAAAAAGRRRGALVRALAWPRPRRDCRCKRCGSGAARMRRTPCAACGRMCAYCEACLGMGRARECGLLVLGSPAPGREPATAVPVAASPAAWPAPHADQTPIPLADRLRHWGLSPAQLAAAGEALRYIEAAPSPLAAADSRPFPCYQKIAARIGLHLSRSTYAEPEHREFLLWAVTGAGKTEMIFPLIESTLQRGGRALLATPRRDVVLELDPRIRKAFPGRSVVTLYGGSSQRWEAGEITLSTTHQLFRFEAAFELVIIDELDAFPYLGDEQLYFAARKVSKPGGARVLLSATPPEDLQRAANRGNLAHARVPVRYHRHPLPVPVLLRIPGTAELISRQAIPVKLIQALRKSLNREAQLFVFVAKIRHVEPLCQLLRGLLKNVMIDGTSSADAERTEKVQRFRKREIRLLITTTILERGVTVPRSDVFIMDAGAGLFDAASLVQMAGRAGRSGDDPFGNVYFCSPDKTRSQASAVRQIMTMNRYARKHGYLLRKEGS
ncbi:DEAD/DEAH box helicase [Paenibacillus pinihumi]|uniref:DEAD/DEAH box helicase n=1 Tax=Paenibacillus pinihumi TaxID=669462 RepID=UPI000414F4F3|nr:helicase-related protein [Paenibacillus pinihumi]